MILQMEQKENNTKTTIAVFLDFNCGYCKRFEQTLNSVLKDYPDLRVVV